MEVSSPAEPVYYYECSGGDFRLIYFLPVRELRGLIRRGRIAEAVLVDHPDGVDLDCTEPDFAEFEERYAYRPSHDPEALCRAFFAMFSSTRNWRKFRGSGFIAAPEIENRLEQVESAVSADVAGAMEAAGPAPSFAARERPALAARRHNAARKSRLESALRKLQVPGIEPGKSLAAQPFRPVRMEKGRSAEAVFVRLHRNNGGS